MLAPPDKLVVLTFDDGSISHLTVAAPLLKELASTRGVPLGCLAL